MGTFKPFDALSEVFKIFSNNIAYTMLRVFVSYLLLVLGAFGMVLIGITLIRSFPDSFRTVSLTEFTPLSIITTYAGFILLGFIYLVFMASILLGLVGSFLRLARNGEMRYDIFASMGRTLAYTGFICIMIVLWVGIISLLVFLSEPLGLLSTSLLGILIFGILYFFFVQFALVPYAIMDGKGATFDAMRVSYMMLEGNRLQFFGAVLLISFLFSTASSVAGAIPFFNLLLSPLVSLIGGGIMYLWYSRIYLDLQ